MDCPRCGTDMMTDCPVCHYEHRLAFKNRIIGRFKRMPQKLLRRAWRMNMRAYLQYKPMLLIGSFMVAVMLAGIIFRTMPWLLMMPALWMAVMVMYDIIQERKEVN